MFDTTVPGEYSFIFSNMQARQDLIVTLALHTYEEKDEEIAFDMDKQGNRFVKNEPNSPEPEDYEDILG